MVTLLKPLSLPLPLSPPPSPSLQARILYVNPSNKEVGLSLLPHLTDMTLPTPIPMLGQVRVACVHVKQCCNVLQCGNSCGPAADVSHKALQEQAFFAT